MSEIWGVWGRGKKAKVDFFLIRQMTSPVLSAIDGRQRWNVNIKGKVRTCKWRKVFHSAACSVIPVH